MRKCNGCFAYIIMRTSLLAQILLKFLEPAVPLVFALHMHLLKDWIFYRNCDVPNTL
jgi:hypothetical protein